MRYLDCLLEINLANTVRNDTTFGNNKYFVNCFVGAASHTVQLRASRKNKAWGAARPGV